jgi:hypothetical protein
MSSLVSPIINARRWALPRELPISPLAGEMSGRTEGGGLALTLLELSHSACVV